MILGLNAKASLAPNIKLLKGKYTLNIRKRIEGGGGKPKATITPSAYLQEYMQAAAIIPTLGISDSLASRHLLLTKLQDTVRP